MHTFKHAHTLRNSVHTTVGTHTLMSLNSLNRGTQTHPDTPRRTQTPKRPKHQSFTVWEPHRATSTSTHRHVDGGRCRRRVLCHLRAPVRAVRGRAARCPRARWMRAHRRRRTSRRMVRALRLLPRALRRRRTFRCRAAVAVARGELCPPQRRPRTRRHRGRRPLRRHRLQPRRHRPRCIKTAWRRTASPSRSRCARRC